MHVTVALLSSLHARLLQIKNVDFNFRSSNLGHNLYPSALVCEDCISVDGATIAKLSKNHDMQFLSVICRRFFCILLSDCAAIVQGLHFP